MTSRLTVEVFGESGNRVVRLPGRTYPGVVIQGDTLHTMVQSLTEASRQLLEHVPPGLHRAVEEVDDVLQALSDWQRLYEESLRREGWDLPYLEASDGPIP